MSKAKEILILFTAVGMEFCWFAAVVIFFFHILAVGDPPLAGLFVVFCLAAALGSIVLGRGWMVVQVLGAHLVALGLALAFVFYTYGYGSWSAGFFNIEWLRELGAGFQDPSMSAPLFFIAVFTALIWFCGERFSRRQTSYSVITARFDLGVAVFFLIFLFGGGLGEQIPALPYFLFPFFLFSMIAIALTHSRGSGEDRPSLASGKIGLVFGVCAVLLISAGVVLLFLIPGMTRVAEVGYSIGRAVTSPVLALLLRILLFLFGGRSRSLNNVDSGSSGAETIIPEIYAEPEIHLWEKYLATGIGILIGVVVTMFVLWGLYLLCRRLLSRTASYEKNSMTLKAFLGYLLDQLRSFCKKIGRFFSLCSAILFPSPETAGEGTLGYRKLLRWGRQGGLHRHPAETPGEYGIRLSSLYPLFKEDIDLIVTGYQQEVYGEYSLETEQGNRIRSARRRLTAPRRRLFILKTKFFTQRKT